MDFGYAPAIAFQCFVDNTFRLRVSKKLLLFLNIKNNVYSSTISLAEVLIIHINILWNNNNNNNNLAKVSTFKINMNCRYVNNNVMLTIVMLLLLC